MRWRSGVALGLGLAMGLLAACGSGAAVVPGGASPFFATTAAVDRLNYYRQQAGLPLAPNNAGLSTGCQAHADYLVRNAISLPTAQLGAHTEDPLSPGFSADGALAGENSIIFQGVAAQTAVDQWLQTLYHRLGLFDPNLKKVGCGAAGDFLVLDDTRGRVRGITALSTYTLFPPAGWTDVPPDYRREIPHPVPGDDSLGIPITVEFFGEQGLSITDVSTTVTDARSGAVLPCYVQWPGHPLLPGWDYQQLIVAIPQDPLPAQCPVEVDITASVDDGPWHAHWVFTTR